MNLYFLLLLGVITAGIGGELFVRGAISLARWARIPVGIIGVTIAAFATSSPEFAVSISAALAGDPQIALGDALGSNIINIGLILGAALLISSIRAPRDQIKRDFPIALLTPLLVGILTLDGLLSRIDGAIMLAVFLTWLAAIVIEARRQRSLPDEQLSKQSGSAALALSILGLGFLILSGRFIVTGAKGIATSFGMDEFVIGATVVAIGTSMPELATTIASKLRGHDEVGLGTILGSNIFNAFWIVSIAALITPIVISWRELIIGLIFGALLVAFTFPSSDGVIGRRRGLLLLTLNFAYLATILQQ